MEQEKQDTATRSEPFILLEVAGATYGIPSRFVQQLEMIGNITPVPNTPAYIEGVMFSRGKVIPLLNLRKRFGYESNGFDIKTRVIVVKNEERTIGLIADTAKEYLYLPLSSIQPAPDFVSGLSTAWLEGIARKEERTIFILNINEITNVEESQHK